MEALGEQHLAIMHVVLNCSLRVGYSYFPALTALRFHRLGCTATCLQQLASAVNGQTFIFHIRLAQGVALRHNERQAAD